MSSTQDLLMCGLVGGFTKPHAGEAKLLQASAGTGSNNQGVGVEVHWQNHRLLSLQLRVGMAHHASCIMHYATFCSPSQKPIQLLIPPFVEDGKHTTEMSERCCLLPDRLLFNMRTTAQNSMQVYEESVWLTRFFIVLQLQEGRRQLTVCCRCCRYPT